jgi:hypothetical protein
MRQREGVQELGPGREPEQVRAPAQAQELEPAQGREPVQAARWALGLQFLEGRA